MTQEDFTTQIAAAIAAGDLALASELQKQMTSVDNFVVGIEVDASQLLS